MSAAGPRGKERDFGPYGGRFVPETLIPALDELEAGWLEARSDCLLYTSPSPRDRS